MKELWKAIDTKLVAQAALVTAVGGAGFIARQQPKVIAKKGLYFHEMDGTPPFGFDTSRVREIPMQFIAVGDDETDCANIGKAFLDLFETGTGQETEKFLFTDLVIHNHKTTIEVIGAINYDEDNKVYKQRILTELWWCYI